MERDRSAPCMTSHTTGMAYSILAEIGQLLTALSERGEAGAIDLRSLPMTDVDRGQLEEILGRGEVRAYSTWQALPKSGRHRTTVSGGSGTRAPGTKSRPKKSR